MRDRFLSVTLRRRPPAALKRALLTVLMDVLNDSHQVQRLEVVDSGRTRWQVDCRRASVKFEVNTNANDLGGDVAGIDA